MKKRGHVAVRVNEQEIAMLKAAAEKLSMGWTTWMRELALERAAEILDKKKGTTIAPSSPVAEQPRVCPKRSRKDDNQRAAASARI